MTLTCALLDVPFHLPGQVIAQCPPVSGGPWSLRPLTGHLWSLAGHSRVSVISSAIGRGLNGVYRSLNHRLKEPSSLPE